MAGSELIAESGCNSENEPEIESESEIDHVDTEVDHTLPLRFSLSTQTELNLCEKCKRSGRSEESFKRFYSRILEGSKDLTSRPVLPRYRRLP